MKKVLAITAALLFSVFAIGQQDRIYVIDSVQSDTLPLNRDEVSRIISTLKKPDAALAVKQMREDKVFLDLINAYALRYQSEDHDLATYAAGYKDEKRKQAYLQKFRAIDKAVKEIAGSNANIVAVELYTNFEDYGDCYFYQQAFAGDSVYKRVNASVIISVLYGKSHEDLQQYKDNVLRIETSGENRKITIPIVADGDYYCDICITFKKA